MNRIWTDSRSFWKAGPEADRFYHRGLPGNKAPVFFFNEKKEQFFRTALVYGTYGDRTHDLPHVKRTLIPAELRFHVTAGLTDK